MFLDGFYKVREWGPKTANESPSNDLANILHPNTGPG